MIDIMNISKHYGEKVALDDVSFSVKKGEIVGLIGKNGAGKSTLLKSIAGILHYDSGRILYNGIDCLQNPSVVQDFGILIDCAFLDYINAYDNLKLLWQLDTKNSTVKNALNDVFDLVGLSDVKNKRVKTYSFGMKQRLGLAQAIINARSLIVLDEPFIGLDPIGKEIVKNAILKKAKDEEYSVLFSSHDLEDVAEICDRIVMIENGVCVYDDVLRRNHEYRIILYNGFNAEMLMQELSTVENVELSGDTIILIDDKENPQINRVLVAVLKHAKVLQIESNTNALKGMFRKGAVQ